MENQNKLRSVLRSALKKNKLEGYCNHYRMYDDPWPTIDDTNKSVNFDRLVISGRSVYHSNGSSAFATRALTSDYSSYFYRMDDGTIKMSCFGGDLVYILRVLP